jgi:membrane associated rhomboid family serine protease
MFPIADSHGTGRIPFWVIVIILINVYVFYLELTTPNPEGFIAQYALVPALIDFSNWGSLWPFITSQFLHGGFLHIISNMWFLWIFGDNVEDRMGFLLFPFFYLACGIAGALAQYLFLIGSDIPMLGASGAIAGVLGAYFAWFSGHKIKTLVPVFGFFSVMDIPASVMLVYWVATQIFAGAFSVTATSSDMGGVAYFAHIGGFVFGWLFAKIYNPQPALKPA